MASLESGTVQCNRGIGNHAGNQAGQPQRGPRHFPIRPSGYWYPNIQKPSGSDAGSGPVWHGTDLQAFGRPERERLHRDGGNRGRRPRGLRDRGGESRPPFYPDGNHHGAGANPGTVGQRSGDFFCCRYAGNNGDHVLHDVLRGLLDHGSVTLRPVPARHGGADAANHPDRGTDNSEPVAGIDLAVSRDTDGGGTNRNLPPSGPRRHSAGTSWHGRDPTPATGAGDS